MIDYKVTVEEKKGYLYGLMTYYDKDHKRIKKINKNSPKKKHL